MDRETRLGLIAASILEGTPVDWLAVESAATAEDEVVLRQLRVLQEVAALHRGLSGDGPTSTTSTATDRTHALTMWGHLRLLDHVGQGSFGEVYRAWDTHLDREVALKLLRANPTPHDPTASISDPSRVVHEGRLLARVHHPHVITVYGAEPRDDRVGIWMEFIHGRTLDAVVREHGPLGAREAAAIGIDLCRALSAVHRAGLLHRDLTARNVMREEGGRIVLMDFGAGRELDTHNPDRQSRGGGEVAGTPFYLAPELLEGLPADRRSETYSLGVLIYYLVTGAYPVTAPSLGEIHDAHRRGERRLLRDARSDLPQPFVQVVEQALSPDPDRRFQTTGALEMALTETVTSGAGVRLTPRTRWWLAAALIVIVAGAVATVTSKWGASNPPASSTPKAGNAGVPLATGASLRKVVSRIEPAVPSNPSEDGRYVAQLDVTSNDAAIADLVTGEQRRLFVGQGNGDGYASLLVLSPDATRVAVDWHVGDRGTLYVVGSDGRGRRDLLGAAYFDAYPYEFSRDNSQLLAAVVTNDRRNFIALVAVADGAVRPIKSIGDAFPNHMSLSRDGRFIVYDYPERPGSTDRDIFIIDTHTGTQNPLVQEAGNDADPFWTPDDGSVLFFSDRSRTMSAWLLPMRVGHEQGVPRLVYENVGRVWPRGFTRDGSLHVQVNSGFAEVHIAALDTTSRAATPVVAQPISPRVAASNFYPEWSPDGRFVAYGSERRPGEPRKLWVLDTTTREERPLAGSLSLGLPLGWTDDGEKILVRGRRDDVQGIFLVDRRSGDVRSIPFGAEVVDVHLTAAGIVGMSRAESAVSVRDVASGRLLKRWDYAASSIASIDLAIDGRSTLALWKGGRVVTRDIEHNRDREWHDMSVASVRRHATSPVGAEVAYVGSGMDAGGEFLALKVWPGSGDARELLKVRSKERLILEGWSSDGQHLLVIRWETPAQPTSSSLGADPPRVLWRVPIRGGDPVPLLSMEGLRDISFHPDGRQIAFNAGWKRYEFWVMENILR